MFCRLRYLERLRVVKNPAFVQSMCVQPATSSYFCKLCKYHKNIQYFRPLDIPNVAVLSDAVHDSAHKNGCGPLPKEESWTPFVQSVSWQSKVIPLHVMKTHDSASRPGHFTLRYPSNRRLECVWIL